MGDKDYTDLLKKNLDFLEKEKEIRDELENTKCSRRNIKI